MTAKKNSANNSGSKTLVGLLVCGVIVVFLLVFVDFVAVADTFIGLGYTPSAGVEELIEKDDLTKNGLRILKASKPELLGAAEFNSKCYSDLERENSVLGCYANNSIYVYDIQNDELDGIKETVLAHELLHAVWHRMSIYERRGLYDDLDQVYAANKDELSEHMSGYTDEEHYDELHSVIGTQIGNSKLTQKLREHYAKYFNKQQTIVSYYDNYNGKFKSLEKRAAELEVLINQKKEQIEAKTQKYESESADLIKNINSFNSRAATGGFADSASFYAERNELVTRQARLQEDYNALNALIVETNTLITEYNSSVVEVGKLYDSVDSRIEKPAGSIDN
jgi:hypothetical protein